MSITLLGQQVESTAPAQIVATAGRRITVVTELAAEPGAAVQIQSPEFVVLAEVLVRQPASSTLVLQVRHWLATEAIAYIRQHWT
jgi:hypothetical protein